MAMPLAYVAGELAIDMGIGYGMDYSACNSLPEELEVQKEAKAKCFEDVRKLKKDGGVYGEMVVIALKYGLGEAALRTFNKAMKKQMAMSLMKPIEKKMGSKMGQKAAVKLAAEMGEKIGKKMARKVAIRSTSKLGLRLAMKASNGPMGWLLLILDLVSIGVDMVDPMGLNTLKSGKDLMEEREMWIKSQNEIFEKQYQAEVAKAISEGLTADDVIRDQYFPYGKELLPEWPEVDEKTRSFTQEHLDKISEYYVQYIMSKVDLSSYEPPSIGEQSEFMKEINSMQDLMLTAEESQTLQDMHKQYYLALQQEYLAFLEEIRKEEDERLEKRRQELVKLQDKRNRVIYIMAAVTVLIFILILVFIIL